MDMQCWSLTPSAATTSGSARGNQAEGGNKVDHLKSRLVVVLARMVRKILLLKCFYLLMFNHFFPKMQLSLGIGNWELAWIANETWSVDSVIVCSWAMNWKWELGALQTRRDLSGFLKLAYALCEILAEA